MIHGHDGPLWASPHNGTRDTPSLRVQGQGGSLALLALIKAKMFIEKYEPPDNQLRLHTHGQCAANAGDLFGEDGVEVKWDLSSACVE